MSAIGRWPMTGMTRSFRIHFFLSRVSLAALRLALYQELLATALKVCPEANLAAPSLALLAL